MTEKGGGGGRIQPPSTVNWGLFARNIDNRNTLQLTLTVRFMLVITTSVNSVYPSFTISPTGGSDSQAPEANVRIFTEFQSRGSLHTAPLN